jgi:hypothetical protein
MCGIVVAMSYFSVNPEILNYARRAMELADLRRIFPG